MLRRGLIADLSIALGEFPSSSSGSLIRPGEELRGGTNCRQVSESPLATPSGTRAHEPILSPCQTRYLTQHRYGYHMPRTNARDNYYKKLEDERAARQGI